MSIGTWFLDLKSTLDTIMINDITADIRADYPNVGYADLDDVAQTDEMLAAEDPAVLWQFIGCEPSPKDPLWTWRFAVGVKTADDSGNYDLATMLSKIMAPWNISSRVVIKDYSGETVGEGIKGAGTVTEHAVAPQQFDHQSGIRLTMIVVKVARCG